MREVEESEEKERVESAALKWTCLKMKRSLDPARPACPDPNIYCKHRTGCLVYHLELLED